MFELPEFAFASADSTTWKGLIGLAFAKAEAVTRPNAQENPENLMIQIECIVRESGHNINDVSLFVEDLESGKTYTRDPDRVFVGASTYKLPLSMLIFDWIREGKLTLNESLPILEGDLEADGPIGQIYGVGSYVRVEDLLSSLILYSDNTAGNVLYRRLGGWLRFAELANAYSSEVDFYQMNTSGNFTSARFSHDCLKTLYLHQQEYEVLIDLMKRANGYFTDPELSAPIAQKWGAFENVKHCIGIVYAERPYIIVVLTENVYEEELFKRINRAVYESLN